MKKILFAVLIAVIFAFVIRLLFGIEPFAGFLAIMSLTFILFLPVGVGMLIIIYSPYEQVEKFWYRFLMPWVPIFIFFVLTLVISLEGWACWLILLPFFLLLASIGGLIGGGIVRRRRKNNNTYVSLLAIIIPFLISPIEQAIGPVKQVYRVDTFIDIHAPASVIWSNVTSVKTITEEEDRGYLNRFLGMPRPILAELDYEGVGAKREAIFSGGLVFHEEVLEYEHEKNMLFSITAHPFEIPSTTMDEHIVVGGAYFDVIDGCYKMEPLEDGKYRLHLYSHFSMNTTFNFYAGWWGHLIMKDIQENILQVIKARAEK